jgi:hypothetical protein
MAAKSGSHYHCKRTTNIAPNIVVEWLPLLLYIRKAQGSNLGPETGYPEVFRGSSQSPYENAGRV